MLSGHTVTALVRDPSKLAQRDGVIVSKGTPTSISDLHEAFAKKRPNCVLVTLNAPRATDSPFAKSISPPRLMADSVANAVKVMKEHGTDRIIVMQAFGVGSSFKNLNFLMRLVIAKTEMSKQFADHNAVDQELREAAQGSNSFTWTMVRPSMLKGEGVMDVKVLGDDGAGGSFMPKTSRESVARFIIEDCAEKRRYDNRTPVICNT